MDKYNWSIDKIKSLHENNRKEIEEAEFGKSIFLSDGFFNDVVVPVLRDGVEQGAFYSDLIINDSEKDKRISIEIHSDPEDINVEEIELIFRYKEDFFDPTKCDMILEHTNARAGVRQNLNVLDYYLSDSAKDLFQSNLMNLFDNLYRRVYK